MKVNRFGFLSVFSIVSVIMFASLFLSGCNMQEVESTWCDRTVIINGKDEDIEWENAKYFFEDKKITLGLLNDEDYLYVRISSRDRAMQRNFMATGFTLWFDPLCKRDKSFGIQFPIGIRSTLQTVGGEMAPGQNADPEQLQKILDDSLKELEIIGPENKEIRKMFVSRIGEVGINLKMDVSKGNMVYELKIPLLRNESNPFGIGTEKTETISIGMIGGNINAEQMRNRIRRDSGDGMVGRGGSMGGVENGVGKRDGMDMGQRGLPGGARGGRVGMPGSGQTSDSIEMWIKIHLAQKGLSPIQ
ncbi:hypothetical protein ACFL2X_00635 [Candidatus Latescibacterota bacterium]